MKRSLAIAVVAVLAACGKPSRQLDRARDLALKGHARAALMAVKGALFALSEDASPQAQDDRLRALKLAGDLLALDLEQPAEAALYYRRVAVEYAGTEDAWAARLRLAELYKDKLKDPVTAATEYLGLVAAYPSHPGVDDVQLRAARAFLDAGNYRQAEAEARALPTRFPSSPLAPGAQVVVGHALHLDGRPADAALALREVATRWPSSPEAPLALAEAGDCLASAGNFRLAVQSYIEALAAHPDPRSVQDQLARVRRRMAQAKPVGYDHAAVFDHRMAARHNVGE